MRRKNRPLCIHYWERRIHPEILEKSIRKVGRVLDEIIGYEFSVLDATSFTNRHKTINGFHLITRISRETVYPAGITNDTFNPVPNTRDVVVDGNGFILADRWYDVNDVYKIAYKNGYIPLISPQRTRRKRLLEEEGKPLERLLPML